MSRSLTSAMQTELAKQDLRLAVFVQIEVASATLYLWSGVGTKTWNAQTWTGLGRFGGVSPIGEDTDVRADGVSLTLSGIPSDLVAYAMTEIRHAKPVKLWLAFLDSSDAVIADPYRCFSGRVDSCDIEEGGETAEIQITAENRLIDLQRSRERRWTHEDQQIDYPGDMGLEYVASLQEKNIVWGKGGTIPASTGSGGSPSGGSGSGGVFPRWP